VTPPGLRSPHRGEKVEALNLLEFLFSRSPVSGASRAPPGHSRELGQRLRGWRRSRGSRTPLFQVVSMFCMASWPETLPHGLSRRPTGRAQGEWEGTVVGVREDGSQFTLRAAMTPQRSRDGMPIGFLATSSDIAPDVRLTVELARTSPDASSTFKSIPDALVTVNTFDEIELANAEAAILHGDSNAGSGPTVELLVADQYLDRHQGFRIAFFPEPQPDPDDTEPQRSVQHPNHRANSYVHKQVEFRRCCDVLRAMRMLWLRPSPSPRSHF
jgi:hypothetical protein